MRTTNGAARDNGIVIIGGGLAGQRCAETLRRCGYERRITIVCAEGHPPYDRPPLSKAVLAGERDPDSLTYKAAAWYEREDVELLLETTAVGLLPVERRVLLCTGASLRYDQLLIATGSRPRTLPQLAGYTNVSVLRTLEDAIELGQVVRAGAQIAVIGAGFIGQEVAATARGRGVDVTMIEAAAGPLHNILGSELSQWFVKLHESEGVRVLAGRTVECVRGNGEVRSLRLSDGEQLAVDHVVVGVGVAPEVQWLGASGLATNAGVPVDECGRTVAGRVLAAGDAAARFDRVRGAHVGGSHWEAAARQGTRAARVMLGLDPGGLGPTSFWTDQYGIRIQYLGNAAGAQRTIVEGDPSRRDFSVTFVRGDTVAAVLLVGRPRQLPAARKLIEKGTLCPIK